MDDNRKSLRVDPATHSRLMIVKAQARLEGFNVSSANDAIDLLIQVWDRARAKGGLYKLVKPPRKR